MAFLAAVHGIALLAVTEFGRSGSLDDVYRQHGIDTDRVVAPRPTSHPA